MTATGQSSALQSIDVAALPELFSTFEEFDGLVVAVSGGADSMALLHLIAQLRDTCAIKGAPGPALVIATVDHGLRPEAKTEACFVAERAQALGFIHETVEWIGEKPTTGLQDAARIARYRLLEEVALKAWASGRIGIVTAHTRDDQVETFLMRLARGSGLEGLAVMDALRPLGPQSHVKLLRPFLNLSKAQLIATLKALGHTWLEDPSNQDERFERVRWRRQRSALDDLGLTDEAIARSITRLQCANTTLNASVCDMALATKLDLHDGLFASFDAQEFAKHADELRVRFLSRLLRAYGGQLLPPRLMKVEALAERLAVQIAADDPTRQTLGGCLIQQRVGMISILREPARQQLPEIELPSDTAMIWDHRFRVSRGQTGKGIISVRALGQDAEELLAPAKVEIIDSIAGVKISDVAATLPGFWRDGHLVSVPLLDSFIPIKADGGSYTAQFVFSDLFAQHADPSCVRARRLISH